MHYTSSTFNGKKLAMLSIGCMRYDSREATKHLVPYCVENGAIFLDTSPFYCFHSEEENNETWVGNAIKGIRDKVILSAKCSTGNGGNEIGKYNPQLGFSITTSDQVRREIEQSLRRLNVDYFDLYELWAAHTPEIYKEAFKKGGWLEGVLRAKEEGLFKHLGMTGHSGNDEIKMWADEGIFECITVPFNLMDISRLGGIKYALSKNIAVLAMNPLAGGMLGGPSEELAKAMSDMGITSAVDLALRYVNAFGVSALAGMSNLEQAKANIEVMSHNMLTENQAIELRDRFFSMINASEYKCSSCGYCMPCPQGIRIPDVFRLKNHANVLGLASAKREYADRRKNDNGFNLENCTACGKCESKCPNRLNIIKLLKEL